MLMGAPPASGSPAVTVVTPCYNVAKYIGEAVNSVRRQTFSNFEYIVVDDGSTDNSAEVARAHAGDDPRFRLVLQKNRGVSAARNAGIREARAPYIAYLDGDDRWRPDFLARQLSLIESHPEAGAVFCRSRVILENGSPVFFQWPRSGRYDFDDLLVASNPARNGSALLIRASCFEDVGGFDESVRHVEDFDMWLRIAKGSKTPLLWGNKHFLVDLRLRPGSVTRDRTAGSVSINNLLEAHTPALQRLPRSLAYVRPAAAALKYGDDEDMAEHWATQARQAGLGRLVRSTWGLRLLFWDSLPRSGRSAVRSAQASARHAVKSAESRLRGSASTG